MTRDNLQCGTCKYNKIYEDYWCMISESRCIKYNINTINDIFKGTRNNKCKLDKEVLDGQKKI